MTDSGDINLTNTSAIIEAFGGIRPMAQKLDVPVSTVQGWKQRDSIPENRAGDVLAAAEAHNVDLSGFEGAFDAPEETESDEAPSADESAPFADSPVIEPAKGGIGGDRGAFFIAVFALIVAVGVGGWTLFGGGGQSGDTALQVDVAEIADRLAKVETTVDADDSEAAQGQFAADLDDLRAKLNRIAERVSDISAPSAEMGDIESRLQAAETRLGQIQRQSASAAQAATAASSSAQDEIAQMRQQLATMGDSRSSTGQQVTEAVGLALAAGRLQRAMDSGAPYQDILASLRAIAPGDDILAAVLDRLAEQGATGAPTRDALSQTFGGVARDIINAADTQAAGGWTDRALQRLRSVASVRRVGTDVPGDGADARVARAEAKLLGGDLGGAVAELDGLTGAAASTAAPWLDGARARLDADASVGEIEALALARLQSSNGGS